jgi:hypothetical protein
VRLSHRALLEACLASLALPKELAAPALQLLATAAATSPGYPEARLKSWPAIQAGLQGLGLGAEVGRACLGAAQQRACLGAAGPASPLLLPACRVVAAPARRVGRSRPESGPRHELAPHGQGGCTGSTRYCRCHGGIRPLPATEVQRPGLAPAPPACSIAFSCPPDAQVVARCKQLAVALPGPVRQQAPELAAYLRGAALGPAAARAAAAALDELAAVVRYLQVGGGGG